MTCDYPAPPCCRCECCKDLPKYMKLTFHGVVDQPGVCDECSWFEGRSFLLERADSGECPMWTYQREEGPCAEEGAEVILDLYLNHPPAEIEGDMDTCEIVLSVDDSSGETCMRLAYFTDLPRDCYNLGTIGLDVEWSGGGASNHCDFDGATVDIVGLDSP